MGLLLPFCELPHNDEYVVKLPQFWHAGQPPRHIRNENKYKNQTGKKSECSGLVFML